MDNLFAMLIAFNLLLVLSFDYALTLPGCQSKISSGCSPCFTIRYSHHGVLVQ